MSKENLTNVFIVASLDYDSNTIFGIYDSEEKALNRKDELVEGEYNRRVALGFYRFVSRDRIENEFSVLEYAFNTPIEMEF